MYSELRKICYKPNADYYWGTLYAAIKEKAATKTTSTASGAAAAAAEAAAEAASSSTKKWSPHTVKSLHVWTLGMEGRTLLLLSASQSLPLLAETVPQHATQTTHTHTYTCTDADI